MTRSPYCTPGAPKGCCWTHAILLRYCDQGCDDLVGREGCPGEEVAWTPNLAPVSPTKEPDAFHRQLSRRSPDADLAEHGGRHSRYVGSLQHRTGRARTRPGQGSEPPGSRNRHSWLHHPHIRRQCPQPVEDPPGAEGSSRCRPDLGTDGKQLPGPALRRPGRSRRNRRGRQVHSLGEDQLSPALGPRIGGLGAAGCFAAADRRARTHSHRSGGS